MIRYQNPKRTGTGTHTGTGTGTGTSSGTKAAFTSKESRADGVTVFFGITPNVKVAHGGAAARRSDPAERSRQAHKKRVDRAFSR